MTPDPTHAELLVHHDEFGKHNRCIMPIEDDIDGATVFADVLGQQNELGWEHVRTVITGIGFRWHGQDHELRKLTINHPGIVMTEEIAVAMEDAWRAAQ